MVLFSESPCSWTPPSPIAGTPYHGAHNSADVDGASPQGTVCGWVDLEVQRLLEQLQADVYDILFKLQGVRERKNHILGVCGQTKKYSACTTQLPSRVCVWNTIHLQSSCQSKQPPRQGHGFKAMVSQLTWHICPASQMSHHLFEVTLLQSPPPQWICLIGKSISASSLPSPQSWGL